MGALGRLLLACCISLAGCGGGTDVAFCFGSDEFCADFFDDTFGDRDQDEDPPPEDEEEPDPAAVALDISRRTPAPIDQALTAGTLAGLGARDPDLIGVWLTASSLGALLAPDNGADTRFLDRNRAWLPAALPDADRGSALGPGLELLAAFAASRDPALAEAAARTARGHVATTTAPAAAADSGEVLHVLRGVDPDACCTTAELAAAALVLCPRAETAHHHDDAAPALRTGCRAVHRWWLARDTR